MILLPTMLFTLPFQNCNCHFKLNNIPALLPGELCRHILSKRTNQAALNKRCLLSVC